jgi:hypothetical protein
MEKKVSNFEAVVLFFLISGVNINWINYNKPSVENILYSPITSKLRI